MSEVTIDLSNYKDRNGERVAPGRYRVIVDDAELTTSKQDNQMIVLWFRVLDGDFKDARIIDRLVQQENSLFRTVAFMQALAIPTPRKRMKFNLRQFIGKVLEVDVEDGDPYNGRVKSEVRGYLKTTQAASQAAGLDASSDWDVDPQRNSDPAQDKVTVPDDGTVDLDTLEL